MEIPTTSSSLLSLYRDNRDAFYLTLSELNYKDLIALCKSNTRLKQLICGPSGDKLWEDLWFRDISKHPLPRDRSYGEEYRKAISKFRNRYSQVAYLDAFSAGYEILGKKLENLPKELNAIASRNDIKDAKSLLGDWNFQSHDLRDSLIIAARHGHENMVKLLLRYGANEYTWAAAAAAQYGHMDLLEFLLKKGGDAINYDRVMMGAINGRYPNVIQKAIDEKWSFDYPSAIKLAKRRGTPEIVEMLEDAEPESDSEDVSE